MCISTIQMQCFDKASTKHGRVTNGYGMLLKLALYMLSIVFRARDRQQGPEKAYDGTVGLHRTA